MLQRLSDVRISQKLPCCRRVPTGPWVVSRDHATKAKVRKWSLRTNFVPPFLKTVQLTDAEIARAQKPREIQEIAGEMGILPQELELYGHHKAKVTLDLLDRFDESAEREGKYVVVTGVTPTPLGEGKTTAVLGLVQALNTFVRKPAIACIRQPSQGPIFGIKGGAAGGGLSQVIPMEEMNLHLTGDIHAVTAANNLLAAAIDARMFHEKNLSDDTLFKRLVQGSSQYHYIPPQDMQPYDRNSNSYFTPAMCNRLKRLGINEHKLPNQLTPAQQARFARLSIDPATITIHRVLDTNDRFLRGIEIGQGPLEKNFTRRTQFDISVASELMAILALCINVEDLTKRISSMVFALDTQGNPLTTEDLGVDGALAVLLRDAIKPTLMQTLDGSPVFIHTGPFANIAHGNSSILADEMALRIVGSDGYVVTEAGFGAEMGIEKFCNIKCRSSGLVPDCVVLVATVRALKTQGGAPKIIPGKPLSNEYLEQRLDLVRKGCANLAKQINNIYAFGIPVVVAVSPFHGDSDHELELVREEALQAGAEDAVIARYHGDGAHGAWQLAQSVEKVCYSRDNGTRFRFLYDLESSSIESKIECIAQRMYGAASVELDDFAKDQATRLEQLGFGNLPICMAKTPYSISHDPALLGAPSGFVLPVQELRLAAGAGFIVAYTGEISTMPGLPTRPNFHDITLEADGSVTGLF